MKRVLLAGVALAALMGSASAADIPRRVVERPVAAPVPHVMAYNWTGFYAGLNAGWGWGTGSLSGPPPTGDMEGNGGLIGGTLGYNWQMNQVVFGVETDLAWSGIEANRRCGVGGGLRCEVNNDWLGTARGRIGLAMDRFMPYVAGGLAYGDVNASVTGLRGASETQVGWTLGGGVEFAHQRSVDREARISLCRSRRFQLRHPLRHRRSRQGGVQLAHRARGFELSSF